ILEDRLAVRREVANAVVVEVEPLLGDAEHADRVADLALESVLVLARRHGLLARREAGEMDLRAGLDESRDQPGAAELVVGVGAEHERPRAPEQHRADGTRRADEARRADGACRPLGFEACRSAGSSSAPGSSGAGAA